MADFVLHVQTLSLTTTDAHMLPIGGINIHRDVQFFNTFKAVSKS